jgi:hypothetical protein
VCGLMLLLVCGAEAKFHLIEPFIWEKLAVEESSTRQNAPPKGGGQAVHEVGME